MPIVQVLPGAVGWTVLGFGEPQFFTSGFRAEQAARRLASALAVESGEAELEIFDRSGQLAGRMRVNGFGGCTPTAGAAVRARTPQRELEPA